jgi:hypothetical protein
MDDFFPRVFREAGKFIGHPSKRGLFATGCFRSQTMKYRVEILRVTPSSEDEK